MFDGLDTELDIIFLISNVVVKLYVCINVLYKGIEVINNDLRFHVL